MASLIAKRKRRKLYYYIVESARVEGKPRIVHQTYLGTVERIAALLQDRTAPLPLSITTVDLGLPGALWRAAQQSGVWEVLEALWEKPASGPSTAHYLLLAAIHRICQPGPKTEVADWFRHTILSSRWGFPAERRSEEHTSELQSPCNLVCRLLLEKKKLSDVSAPAQLQLPATTAYYTPR